MVSTYTIEDVKNTIVGKTRVMITFNDGNAWLLIPDKANPQRKREV